MNEVGSKLILIRSIFLVSLQFGLILLLLSGTSFDHFSFIATLLIIISFLLMGWAVVVMQKSKLRIRPEPSEAAILITNGPYANVRHPMYSAVILGSLGLVIQEFNWLRVAMLVALIIVLVIKLSWEEKMLTEKFPTYKAYSQNTYKLIPAVY